MATDREQQLVDICFEIAMVASNQMYGRSPEFIAKWVATQLKQCGFSTTPCGSSWGVLDKEKADGSSQT